MAKNVIVGQSGGPTAVINSSLIGVFQAARKRGAEHVYGMVHGIEGFKEGRYVDLTERVTSTMDIELMKRTPASYLGSCRYKLPDIEKDPALYENLFNRFQELDVGYVFYIGGNDSMDTINKLSIYARKIGSDIRCMGVPKTVDNDLVSTDHTPGYGSAAKYIATSLKEIIRDSLAYGKKTACVVEIMGRNAGWLTAAAAMAKGEDCEGVDMICLPEVVFDVQDFLAKVAALHARKNNVTIAVSEGVKVADGRYVCELADDKHAVDAFGHKQLTGTSRYLADLLNREQGVKARAIELSTLQRCASHLASLVDIDEAYQVGGAAVRAAFDGHTGEMVALKRLSNHPYQCTTELRPISEIANMEKKIPMEWITVDHTNVTAECLSYMRPLILTELSPIYVNGLPRHMYLEEA